LRVRRARIHLFLFGSDTALTDRALPPERLLALRALPRAEVSCLVSIVLRSLRSGTVDTGLPLMIVITPVCVGTLRGLVQARRAHAGTV
jgi:hypothetical protein